MAKQVKSVLGVTAPRARPTLVGAFWLAALIAIPVGVLGLLAELVVRTIW